MLKKIRDFIYDINDIFVAIIILLAAAGIIIWRSTAIMAYPDYLAGKNPQSNSVNVDFSGIDLTPENVENITQNIEIIEPTVPDPNAQTDPSQGGTEDPNAQADPSQGGTEDPNTQADPNQGGTEDPNAQTDPNQGGTQDPNAQTDPNQGGEQQPQTGTVTATIEVPPFAKGGKWPNIAKLMADAGLIRSDEIDAFVAKVKEMGLEQGLQQGKHELTNTSYEDMIKVLCNKK